MISQHLAEMMKRIDFKKKGKSELSRPTGIDNVAKRILIVTEGSKTEVTYLKNLRHDLKAKTADIEVTGDSDPSPNKVYDHAVETLKNDPDFDYVYLVIDRDRHTTYDSTIIKASKKVRGTKATFKVISSVPCFEFWLMLHVANTAKPYAASVAGGSPAEELLRDLKTSNPCFSRYEKSKCEYYQSIRENLNIAKQQSKAILDAAAATGDRPHHENPSTRMHILVEDMENLIAKGLKK
jgi:hypothetical protein